MSEVWTDAENDALVADYLAMLRGELRGERYSKAEHNRALQDRIGRGRGAIEFKHQNVTAVLMGLGEPWIEGYKPAPNFQGSLVTAVVRALRDADADLSLGHSEGAGSGVIPFGPAPTLRNEPPPSGIEPILAIARKFDVVETQARNRALGRAGEERVLRHERAVLVRAGRDDLAGRVRWTSEEEGDGAGYDIASFEPSGAPRLVEVKTTQGWERTPFHISRRELDVAEAQPETWRLVRVWNFARTPKAFEIAPPLERHVALIPTDFRAEFGFGS